MKIVAFAFAVGFVSAWAVGKLALAAFENHQPAD